jgi:DNA helicase-2/ATP-dependent DNA helicase PcrA
MQDYLKTLNPQQLEAATTTEGPLLILAGAGSGKTGTMTRRIAYMIDEADISPYSILAVTFTNKAAGEMRERVESLVGEVPGMWIQTFHSACLRILRSDADKIGYERNFVVYDPVDQKSLIKGIIKDMNLDEKRFSPAYVLSAISQQKEQQVGPSEYLRKYGSLQQYKELAALYRRYEEALKKNNAMDFDDLVLRTVQLFERDEAVLRKYQDKFHYVMVDEYQDTNLLQYRFVSLLAEKSRNICVVGDDDQCIYQWRGADIRNILEFEKDFPGARVIKLEENYRSTGNILEAAYSVISRNRGRKSKKLWTKAGAGEKVEYYRADDDHDEARYVGAKIESLRRQDPSLKYSDLAVLYRANVQSRRFEDAFSAKGIPYQVLSGLRYYDRKEIKDLMCYMRLVLNPKDDTSFERVINEPKRGFGEKALSTVRYAAKVNGLSLLEALGTAEVRSELSAKAAAAAEEVYDLLRSLNETWQSMSVEEVYDTLLVKTGYLASLEAQESVESDSRIENLMEFKSVILEKQKDADGAGEEFTLENFMEGVALISDIDNKDDEADSVALMTLHSAKGLEFPVVFMPGMELGVFPSYRAIDRGEGMEEERRLCYVGMTRAKKRLFMTSADTRTLYGKTDYTTESPFMKEIDRKYLTGHAVYDKKGQGLSYDRYSTVAESYSGGKYVSPLASVAAAKQEAKRETLKDTAVQPGDLVEHPKFGRGTVIEQNGSVLTVIFESCGTKKLAKDLAPLKKID